MHPAKLAARQTVAQAPLLVAMLGLAFLVTALTAGIPRYLGLAAVTSSREALAAAQPMDVAVQAQLRLAGDGAEQSREVTGVLDELFEGTSVVVHRTVQSPPVSTTLPSGEAAEIILGADAGFADRVRLVAGPWPAASGDPIPAAMMADAAAALGLEVGDVVPVGDTDARLEITATWLPLDSTDPHWFGDTAVATGESAGAFGPLMMDESALAELDLNPFVRWTVVPEEEKVTAAELPTLGAAARAAEDRLRESGVASGLVFAGGLGATVGTLERSIDSVRGVSPVPLVLTAVIGFLALVQLARLLADVRAAETLLLKARGRSVARATVSALLEGAVVAIPGAALGAVVALLGVPTLAVPVLDALLTAAAVALVTIVALAAVAWRAARARTARRDTERTAAGATIGVLSLTLLAAGVSLWQFRLYGSPLVTTASGERIVDPVAVLAPSLGLLAFAVIALALFAPLAAIVARIAASDPGITRVLPARQVARRVRTYAVPLLLVCLAVGGTTVASAYSATWSALNTRAGELRNGSDVRVLLPTGGAVGGAEGIVSSPPYAIDGAEATPVLLATTEAGDENVSVVGVASSGIRDIMSDLGGTIDRVGTAALVETPARGILLPDDAEHIALTTTASTTMVVAGAARAPGQGDVATTVWVVDAQGALAKLQLADDEGATTSSAELPTGVAPWTVLAVDATITNGPNAATYAFSVDALSTESGSGAASEVDLGADDWATQSDAAGAVAGIVVSRGGGLALEATITQPGPPVTIRLMRGTATPVPAVVTQAFADRLGLAAGDRLDLRFAGSGLALTVEVAATASLIPGATSGSAALIDLRGAVDQLLRATSSVPKPGALWISSSDPEAIVAAVAGIAPAGASVTTIESGSGNTLLRPVVTALWIGSAGTLLLSIVSIAVVAGTLGRTRRPDVVALRAVGLSDAQQARGRQRELAGVVAFAALFGILGGVSVSLLTVGELARSAVLDAPGTLPAMVQFDVVPGAALLAGLVALAVAVIAWQAVAVRRQAAASTGREVDS